MRRKSFNSKSSGTRHGSQSNPPLTSHVYTQLSKTISFDSLRLSSEPASEKRLTADGLTNNERLYNALVACLDAEARIPEEQEKLRSLLPTVPPDSVEYRYIEYQIELVARQLTRAAEVAEARLAHWHTIRTVADEARENAICESDTKYWLKWWAWSVDPREDSPLALTPFVPFDKQNDAVDWFENLLFVLRKHGLMEKSRDMGATWLFILVSVKHWLFRPLFTALWGSINEDKVDKIGAKDTIFEKARVQLRLLPEFMMPAGYKEEKHATYLKIFNPANESMLSGEASTQNFGRSGRYSVAFLDEHAFWPFLGKPQWASVSSSVKTCICFSSVNGKRTKQYELRTTPKFAVFTLKWTQHPWKDERWYKALSQSMKPHEIAAEIDIDYSASVAGKLLSEFSELHHIVTWSEFAEMFGAVARDANGKPRLPAKGLIGRGQDVGTTEQHPNATLWAWRPAEGMPYEAWPFLYREAVFPEYPTPSGIPVSIGRIAEHIHDVEKPWAERARVQMSVMSHEAASERMTYVHDVPIDHQIHWSPWAVAARAGVAQIQNFLHIDWSQRHPVRRYPMGYVENGEDLGGQLLHGRPRMLIIVADGQGEIYLGDGGVLAVVDAIDSDGMARLRAETPQYALPQDTSGDEKKEVKPLFNDCIDAWKGLAQKFFPTPEESSVYERVHRALEAQGSLLDMTAFAEMDPVAQSVAIIRNMTTFSRELNKQESREAAIVNERFQNYQE